MMFHRFMSLLLKLESGLIVARLPPFVGAGAVGRGAGTGASSNRPGTNKKRQSFLGRPTRDRVRKVRFQSYSRAYSSGKAPEGEETDDDNSNDDQDPTFPLATKEMTTMMTTTQNPMTTPLATATTPKGFSNYLPSFLRPHPTNSATSASYVLFRSAPPVCLLRVRWMRISRVFDCVRLGVFFFESPCQKIAERCLRIVVSNYDFM